MTRLDKSMLAALGYGLLAVVLSSILIYPAAAQVPSVPVKVTNTPLPVAGNVNVANTPAVIVSGTPAVTITNTNANPVPVALAPTHFQTLLQWLNNGALGTSCYTVPSGKRFVIEYANVHAILGQWIQPDGNLLPEVLLTVWDNGSDFLQLELGPTGRVVQENNRFFVASLPMKVVLEPGQSACISNNSTVSASAWVFLSGHFEPVQ